MIVQIKDKEVKLPDFLIVGAAKSGTTSLYFYLQQCPEIYFPVTKEPSFFSFMDNPPNFADKSPALKKAKWKLSDYAKLFTNAKENQIIGEASTSYLYAYKNTINNIKITYGEDYKKLKIIIIFRNPAQRAWSYFMMNRRAGVEPLDFEEAVNPRTIKERLKKNFVIYYDYIGFGMYYNQIKAYFDEFPDVKVFLFDELVDNNIGLMKETLKFLEVDNEFIPENINKIFNISGDPKNIFVYPVYKLIFHNNIIKDKLRSIIPDDQKEKITSWFGRRILKKKKLDKELKKKIISEYYFEDINKLKTLLKDKKDTLQGWQNI